MEELRAEFPVFERLAYLNAGTNGPVPRGAVEAAAAAIREQAEGGRGSAPFFEQVLSTIGRLRRRVAGLFGCEPGEVAITGSTTDGVNVVLNALDLRPGDDVVTSDEEHPGVLAPLAAARERHGIRVREVPFESLAGEVTPDTRLVACSHVSWITGRVVDAEDIAVAGVPVLLDGAQGLGAVPVDVKALGCDFYAASGQKWLCGPQGLGYLYVRGDRAAELPPPWPGYITLSGSGSPLEFELHTDCRRFDLGLPGTHHSAWALAALDALERPGIERVHDHAAGLADRLARELAGRGVKVAPRGSSTLVSWEDADPAATVRRMADDGIVVRNLPGTSYIRASVGGWTSEHDLERVLATAL
jgi:selenocysteine lyase/cysteine desulfurase